MSRSGYSDDCDYDQNLNLYRANVDRTIAGKRGQAFLREMAAALDAMPVKELVADDIVRDENHVCAIGSVALARKMDVANVDPYDGDSVAAAFGISRILACEIAYKNDECSPTRYERTPEGYSRRLPGETPAERWLRMRKWVAACITAKETT